MQFIRKRNDSIESISNDSTMNRLGRMRLPGCPFKNYYALDLVRDLLYMYSWRMEFGRKYDISEFLTLCNDSKAEAYRDRILYCVSE